MLYQYRSAAITPTLVFTVSPESVTRGENFSITVQMQDGSGNVIDWYYGSATLTLNDANNLDALSETTITFYAGVAETTTEQITGGLGEYEATITVTAGSVSSTTDAFTIEYTDSYLGYAYMDVTITYVASSTPYDSEVPADVAFSDAFNANMATLSGNHRLWAVSSGNPGWKTYPFTDDGQLMNILIQREGGNWIGNFRWGNHINDDLRADASGNDFYSVYNDWTDFAPGYIGSFIIGASTYSDDAVTYGGDTARITVARTSFVFEITHWESA